MSNESEEDFVAYWYQKWLRNLLYSQFSGRYEIQDA